MIFVTKEDYAAPGRVPAALLEDEDDDEPGAQKSCRVFSGASSGDSPEVSQFLIFTACLSRE